MVLIPNFPMLKVAILSQVLNGVLLPVVLIFMLKLINKHELMGKYTNTLLVQHRRVEHRHHRHRPVDGACLEQPARRLVVVLRVQSSLPSDKSRISPRSAARKS